jgi:hypothetical protein
MWGTVREMEKWATSLSQAEKRGLSVPTAELRQLWVTWQGATPAGTALTQRRHKKV